MHLHLLDVDILKEAAKTLRENLNHRSAIMVLTPNPRMQMAKDQLDSAKVKQLELYIALAEHIQIIGQCEKAIGVTEANDDILSNLFK